jgi:hypothetical protein
MGHNVVMAKTLTVYLAADVSRLTRGLNSARGDVLGFDKSISGIGNKLTSMLGPAFIGAGIAAGAFAVKLGVDGVKAALEDAASIDKLAQTLDNLNQAHRTDDIEKYISSLERSLGIADTELRPAYDRLIRSIGDVGEANRVLGIALDVSAGSGKSLQAVVEALGKAYDGNISGLSRLGAGIDAATLRTGDLDLITNKLATTFAGQAKTSAATMEGQLKVLQIAVDNVGEAFGTGLLEALGDTNDETTDLVSTMEDLEPAIKNLGDTVGQTFIGLLNITNSLIEADRAANDLINKFGPLRIAINAIPGPMNIFNTLTTASTFAMEALGNEAEALPGSLSGTVQAAIDGGKAMRGLAVSTATASEALAEIADKPSTAFYQVLAQLNKGAVQSNYSLDRFDKTLDQVGSSAGSASTGVKDLESAVTASTPAFDKALELVDATKTSLDAETRALEAATTARNNYVNSLVGQITGGFDLGAGFTMKDGQVDAAMWNAGVEAELAKTEWYGNVLKAVQAEDATNGRALAEYLAQQGIDKGAVWGQALLDEGLVPEMGRKLQSAVDSATLIAEAMAPPFSESGAEAGINLVNGLAGQLQTDVSKLSKLGTNIGKPIGASLKAEIAQAVSDAIAAANAAGSAARAEVAAREAAAQAAQTEQATAQSLARIIRNSDSRAGRNVQPVLT